MEFRPFSGVIVGGQRLTPHEAEVLIDNLLGERSYCQMWCME